MERTGSKLQQTTVSRLLLLLTLFLCLVLSCAQYTLVDFGREGSVHAVDKKRSSMDLAFMQMYQLCDRNRDALFSHQELHCLRDLLRLLIGARNK